MEEKKHEIKTVKDILNAVNEDNLKAFIVDFEAYLTTVIAFGEMNAILGGEKDISDGFTWIDDGEHNATIRLTEK